MLRNTQIAHDNNFEHNEEFEQLGEKYNKAW